MDNGCSLKHWFVRKHKTKCPCLWGTECQPGWLNLKAHSRWLVCGFKLLWPFALLYTAFSINMTGARNILPSCNINTFAHFAPSLKRYTDWCWGMKPVWQNHALTLSLPKTACCWCSPFQEESCMQVKQTRNVNFLELYLPWPHMNRT